MKTFALKKGAIKRKLKLSLYFIFLNILLFFLLAPFVIFYGPFQALKAFTVGTIITSRHPQVAELFISREQAQELYNTYNAGKIAVEPVIFSKENRIVDSANGLIIEEISGRYFKGRVMLVKDPLRIKVAVTKELGTAGQRLSELVSENKALAGINGGGFYDPNAQGNGAYPEGITVVEGKVIHNSVGSEAVNVLGFDHNGKLLMKKITAAEVGDAGFKYALSFEPNLIREGKPLIEGDGGWGLAPRTGLGQKADGTVIMVVIDGRLPNWSMGATLRDLMNVFIEYGAENAVNLDGGSSTEMIYQGRIVNRLWNIFGERYIPTAFIVMPEKQ